MNGNEMEPVTRYSHNPILTKDDVPYPLATVHDAAVVKHNGKYIMGQLYLTKMRKASRDSES